MTRYGWLIFISIFFKVIRVIEASWWAALFPLWCLIIWCFILEMLKEKKW